MTITTEQIIAFAPSAPEIVTKENLAQLSQKHAHPFTEVERLRPGDVIWAPYFHTGNHLVVVWVGEQRAGLGRNGHELAEGDLEIRGDKLLLHTDDGDVFDLRTGAPFP